jgi:hypothetical protein
MELEAERAERGGHGWEELGGRGAQGACLGLRRAPAAQIYRMAGGGEISEGEREKRAGAADDGKQIRERVVSGGEITTCEATFKKNAHEPTPFWRYYTVHEIRRWLEDRKKRIFLFSLFFEQN